MSYATIQENIVRVVEANLTKQIITTNRISLLFFVGFDSLGLEAIYTKPVFKLSVVLGGNAVPHKVSDIRTSPLSSGTFREANVKSFIVYPNGREEEKNYTLDNHGTFPVINMQGNLYFEVPINDGEFIMTSSLTAHL